LGWSIPGPQPAKAVRERDHRLHLQRGGVGPEAGRARPAQRQKRHLVPRGLWRFETVCSGRPALACFRGRWPRLRLWWPPHAPRRRSAAGGERVPDVEAAGGAASVPDVLEEVACTVEIIRIVGASVGETHNHDHRLGARCVLKHHSWRSSPADALGRFQNLEPIFALMLDG
jgi:hypothetical protein